MSTLRPGEEFAGHRIESLAGRGGMGVVYRATHLALDLTVALKVIAPEYAEDPEFRERFKRESRLAASLDHPNVIPIRHAGEEDGLLYVTMRYVDGSDLGRAISRSDGLPPAAAVAIVADVAAALDAAHQRGLVHRDIKPGNILLEERGGAPRTYLTDFGLTRHQQGTARLTRTGQWMGTLDYVAPEQIRGADVDGRADFYSLGCVLYHAIAGDVPFPRDSEVAAIYAQLEDATPALAGAVEGVSAELDAVVQRATAKRPGDRYSSGAEFADDAKAALRAPAVPVAAAAPPPPAAPAPAAAEGSEGFRPPDPAATRTAAGAPPTRAAASPRRRLPRALVPAVALAALAAVAVAVLAGGGGGDDEPSSTSDSPPPIAAGGGGGGGGEGGASAGGAGTGTLAAFRTRADAICTDMEAGVEDAFAQIETEVGGYDPTGAAALPPEAQIEFLEQRSAIVRDGLGRLRSVRVPPDQRAAYRDYLRYRSAFADQLVALRGALINRDPGAAAAATEEMRGLLEKKMAAGEELGLMACADRLPGRDRREVERLAADFVTGSTPQVCRRLTQDFLAGVYGGSLANCEARAPAAAEADLVDLFGVRGVHATVTFSTGGAEVPVFLDHEPGGWRIDGVGRPRS
jgi:hypothetical protein